MNVNVKVNTDIMKDQANLVRNDVRNIDKHWKSICKLVQSTRSYWEGEASDTHFKVFHDVEPDVTKVITRLDSNHEKLMIEAGVYEAAEKNAEGEANSLVSDIF